MKYSNGDKAIIIRNDYGHKFEIGSIVEIIDSPEGEIKGLYKAKTNGQEYFVVDDEMIPYEFIKNIIVEELSK